MELLRVATSEEISRIQATSDLDGTCQVVALDTPKGAILFVIRRPVEIDPVYMPEGFTPRHWSMAIRDISNYLLGQGVTHYYFNLHADDKPYRDAMENWGATAVSTEPDIRYKKVIFNPPQVIEAPNSI